MSLFNYTSTITISFTLSLAVGTYLASYPGSQGGGEREPGYEASTYHTRVQRSKSFPAAVTWDYTGSVIVEYSPSLSIMYSWLYQ